MRKDVDTTAPNLTIRANEQVHSESEIRVILEIMRPHARVHAAKEYTFAIDLPTAITIIIAIPIYFFSKGFFTKLGEKLADEVGADAVLAYRKLKETVARLLIRKAQGEGASLRFELVSTDKESLEVHAKVESSAARDFEQAFDLLEGLAAQASQDAAEVRQALGQEIVRSHYRYMADTSTWILTWALTDKGRFVSLKED